MKNLAPLIADIRHCVAYRTLSSHRRVTLPSGRVVRFYFQSFRYQSLLRLVQSFPMNNQTNANSIATAQKPTNSETFADKVERIATADSLALKAESRRLRADYRNEEMPSL